MIGWRTWPGIANHARRLRFNCSVDLFFNSLIKLRRDGKKIMFLIDLDDANCHVLWNIELALLRQLLHSCYKNSGQVQS